MWQVEVEEVARGEIQIQMQTARFSGFQLQFALPHAIAVSLDSECQFKAETIDKLKSKTPCICVSPSLLIHCPLLQLECECNDGKRPIESSGVICVVCVLLDKD
ncbi:hypothetical protein ACLKA6_006926 [Drosophila palustris]